MTPTRTKLPANAQTVQEPNQIWKMDIGAAHGGISSRTPDERAKLIRYRKPEDLLPLLHPLNEKIYGEAVVDEALLKSIREDGVIEPIVICLATVPHYAKAQGGHRGQLEYVISGHRRLAAAIKVGLKKVPVRVMFESETSEAQVVKYLILYNQQRVRGEKIKAREAAELATAEEHLAKERMEAGKAATETDPMAKSPEGTTRKAVGKALGVGEKKAEQMIAIGKKMESDSEVKIQIDAAFDSGQSVNRIHQEYVKSKPPQNPEVKVALEAHIAKTRELNDRTDIVWRDMEVTRSKELGKFHLMLRNVTEAQIDKIVESWDEQDTVDESSEPGTNPATSTQYFTDSQNRLHRQGPNQARLNRWNDHTWSSVKTAKSALIQISPEKAHELFPRAYGVVARGAAPAIPAQKVKS
jgi:ParB-like chromosome segregation protein Spo0J